MAASPAGATLTPPTPLTVPSGVTRSSSLGEAEATYRSPEPTMAMALGTKLTGPPSTTNGPAPPTVVVIVPSEPIRRTRPESVR